MNCNRPYEIFAMSSPQFITKKKYSVTLDFDVYEDFNPYEIDWKKIFQIEGQENLEVNIENIDAINAPQNAPAIIPYYAFPSQKTAPSAPTAPLNIIPSTPRLRTPLFSVINSPVAANKRGIEVAIIVNISASIIM